MKLTQRTIRFELGKAVITTNANRTLRFLDVVACIRRHAVGDWGEVSPDDAAANEYALLHGLRLLSVYRDQNQTQFWIITEADRSSSTILLPSDY